MLDIALLGLIVAGIAIGYLLGRRDQYRKEQGKDKGPSKDYFVGLNYLLNEQTDEAIETFIKVLDVSNDTVDTHLALGSLFCKRGEVDKSIRLHQDLLARPSLTSAQSFRVQLALSKDYFSAGMLDRAESILVDITSHDNPVQLEALTELLNLYEREREWPSAVAVAKRLQSIQGDRFMIHLAHYYCELSEQQLSENNRVAVRQSLRQAFSQDKNNVRASLLLGKIEFEEGNYKESIKVLQKISRQDMAFVSLSLPLLELAYDCLMGRKGLRLYLEKCLDERPSSAIILSMTRILLRDYSHGEAIQFLSYQLDKHPTLKGLNVLMDLQLRFQPREMEGELEIIRRLSDKILESKPIYRCSKCGFGGRKMHWQCPGCRSWQSVMPIQGAEGE